MAQWRAPGLWRLVVRCTLLGTWWCEELTLRVNERAGQPASQADLVDVAKLVTSYYALHPDPADPRAEGQLRHVGTPRLGAALLVQRGSHRRHHPGHLRLPGRAGHHRAAVSGPGHARAVRARLGDRAGGPRGQRRERAGGRRDGYTPTPALSRAILAYNDGRDDGLAPTGSWSPRRTTRPRMAGSSTTRRDGGPAGSDDHLGSSRTGPTSCWPAGCARCAGSATRRPAARTTRPRSTSSAVRGRPPGRG